MPVVKDAVKPKKGAGSANRVETNNQVELAPKKGTARFTIEDIWLYPCDERGKYAKHTHAANAECGSDCPVTGTKSKWALRLKKNPEIVLENRMLCGLGPKSKFQQRLGLLTGTEPGSDECRGIDTDDLVGRDVLCTYALNEKGYTDIADVLPLEEDDAPAPAEQKAADLEPQGGIIGGQASIITDLLIRAKRELKWEDPTVRKATHTVTNGRTVKWQEMTAREADAFIARLQTKLPKEAVR